MGLGFGRGITRSLMWTSADGADACTTAAGAGPATASSVGGVSIRRWIIGPTTVNPSAREACRNGSDHQDHGGPARWRERFVPLD